MEYQIQNKKTLELLKLKFLNYSNKKINIVQVLVKKHYSPHSEAYIDFKNKEIVFNIKLIFKNNKIIYKPTFIYDSYLAICNNSTKSGICNITKQYCPLLNLEQLNFDTFSFNKRKINNSCLTTPEKFKEFTITLIIPNIKNE